VCDGYQCGDDGCGGSCGTCGAGSSCEDHLCIPDPCSPDPCNGHGACAPGAPGAPPVCQCGVGFTGASCNSCASGYAGYPACALDLCPADACSGHGACSPTDGSCTCEAGFRGAACNVCEPGHGLFPHCTVPRCGDGVFDPGEACDDGDTTPGDGCSATCAIEPGWDCTNSPNLNTGSDGAGGQAALGAFDLVWTWSAGPGGTPQPAVVDDNCAPGLWAPEPLWARWISRYGCNQSTPPDTVSHYTATFDIPPGAERITRINGTIWADNAIDDVIVNGTTTGLTSGVEGYQGSGIAFGSWPNSLYRAGRNELTVVVYNAPGTGLNPDGLLVSVAGAFGAGSVCSRP
jgi:cysteine-rich repeat protein